MALGQKKTENNAGGSTGEETSQAVLCTLLRARDPRKFERPVLAKLIKMATRKNTFIHPQDNNDTTFELSSIDSTAVEEKLFGETEADEDGDNGPVVFICGNCKLPVGDSTSWDGSEDSQNQIRLKRESGFDVTIFCFSSAKIRD